MEFIPYKPRTEKILGRDWKFIQQSHHMSSYYIPAKKATVIPVSTYTAIICKIPEGKLARWEDITAYFEKIYGVEYVKTADEY